MEAASIRGAGPQGGRSSRAALLLRANHAGPPAPPAFEPTPLTTLFADDLRG